MRNVELYLGIYTGILDCIVKLPEEVCASHTKHIGDNKKSFKTQVVRRHAAHWFYFKKLKNCVSLDFRRLSLKRILLNRDSAPHNSPEPFAWTWHVAVITEYKMTGFTNQ